MKKRNPLAVFFLSIVTFGIYDLYWLAVTKNELNQKTSTKIPSIWLLAAPFVLIIVLFSIIFFSAMNSVKSGNNNTVTSYSTSTSITTTSTSTAATNKASLVILIAYGLAFIAIVPITFYWFWKFSKSVNEYTSGTMSTAVAFLLLWLLHFIGVALVQDKFNDMIDQGTQPSAPMPNQTPPSQPPVVPAQS